MKLTIIKSDGMVVVDGVGYSGLDLSFLSETVHAVQWDGTAGEIEHKDPVTKKMTANELINSIDQFQPAIDVWTNANIAAQAAAVAQAEAEAAAQEEAQQANGANQ